MRDELLPFSPPFLGEEEVDEVVSTLRSDWISTGPRTGLFEQEFARSVDAPAALALSSCTAALHLALVTLGVGPGDAVITTPMTFCSGVHAIEHVGALPVLADVEADTLNLNPTKVREAIDWLARTHPEIRAKAIIAVHLYGHPCEMDSLVDIAREHRLAIIEDAAHALPARYKGRLIGARHPAASGVTVLTCFSFYATKNITTGEGGMLTGDPDLIDEARVWSLHGMSRDAWKRYAAEGSWFYEVVRPGFKYNMTDIQAALGIQQLRKLAGFHARRRQIAHRYNEAFSAVSALRTPVERKEVEHAWHLYVLRLNPGALQLPRNQFINELKARNISASVHFIPIHVHPYYRDKYGYRVQDLPVAQREYERMLSLPLFPRMSNRDVEDVIEAVLDVVSTQQRPKFVAAEK